MVRAQSHGGSLAHGLRGERRVLTFSGSSFVSDSLARFLGGVLCVENCFMFLEDATRRIAILHALVITNLLAERLWGVNVDAHFGPYDVRNQLK